MREVQSISASTAYAGTLAKYKYTQVNSRLRVGLAATPSTQPTPFHCYVLHIPVRTVVYPQQHDTLSLPPYQEIAHVQGISIDLNTMPAQ